MTSPPRLEPLPPGRRCAACGGETRFSHVVYAGRGERVPVHVCRGCGAAYRGAPRPAGEETAPRTPAGQRERRAPGRRQLEEGPPENPVLDAETARRLRDLLGP